MKRLSIFGLLLLPSVALADDETSVAKRSFEENPGIVYTLKPRVHASLGAATALSAPQNDEFSWGGGGSLLLEVPLANFFSVQGGINSYFLSNGEAPAARFKDHSYGTSHGALLGVRVQQYSNYKPMTQGVWASLGVGVAFTGDLVRPTLGAEVGYDFPLGTASKAAMGPVLGYTWVTQPDSNVRPEDAHLIFFGIHFVYGTRRSDEDSLKNTDCTDRDADGICDALDKCPDTTALSNADPERPGCPRGDKDGDGIFDSEDACPDDAGVRTGDPKTNGCPRRDRDNDTVFDDEDACPEEPGIKTKDPATNGCPRRDEDEDTIFDDEDACPTVPGVRTTDPATNGCPPSKDGIRLEGDSISLDDVVQFERDSPRVRHVSWGLVQKVAGFISSTPGILVVDVQGHADESGTPEHNLKLSQDRADSVKALLVKFGVDNGRITTHAYGQMKPRVQGKQETVRGQNRRVEFVVVKAAKSGGAVK